MSIYIVPLLAPHVGVGAFLIADEICLAYALEATHLRLLTSQLVTLLAIELLPEERGRHWRRDQGEVGSRAGD